ncbi:MAG: pyridoxal phosphate-dependent aminotransferase [Muribaculaceae bacterium]
MTDFTAAFDRGVERRGTGSYKWDSVPGLLPLWVADMDFATAPVIIDALHRRVDMGAFGYTLVGEDYYRAVADWFGRRHGWAIERDSIMYTSGVVPALSAIIKALTAPGDKVIVQTPVYNCFFSSIRNNGCEILANPLRYTSDSYEMDFDDLAAKVADPAAKVLLLCNPGNPVGRVWTRDELTTLAGLCHDNGVVVVSDEIHCELVYPGYRYTPYGTLPREFVEQSVTCVSPSKAFNTAGLQIASIITPNADFRRRIDRAININEVCDVNPFGIVGTIAAYNEGEEWLEQLIAYLKGNYDMMADFCRSRMPQLPICRLEGTYLVWMNVAALGMTGEELGKRLIDEQSLWLNAGEMYGDDHFIRWNIACPRTRLAEALGRFEKFVKKHT